MDQLDRTLSALANPTRRRIVGRLAHGVATVSELVECFELTQPTISSHLRTLEGAGLISRSQVAQTRPCKLETQSLAGLGSWLGQLRTIYGDNYERLDDVLNTLKAQEEGLNP